MSNVESINDHMAYICECGSAHFCILKSGLMECAGCLTRFDMNDRCLKCHDQMVAGKATGQTYTGIPDFPGDEYPVTVSPGGPGRLIDVLKCRGCGFSVSKGGSDE